MITNDVKPRKWTPENGNTVTLKTKNSAVLTATYDHSAYEGSFELANTGYYFDAPACREAAEYFTLLAEILEGK